MLRRALLALLPALPALAQRPWPTRPMRLVVPFPPGGLADQLARPLAARLTAVLGQPMVVENRPGAGGNIGADAVAKAAPDGYSWLLGSIGPLAANQFLFASMPFDTATAFAPVSLLVNTPKVIVVNRDRPWRSLAEMLAAARAAPGAVRAGSAGNGSSLHIALALLNRAARVARRLRSSRAFRRKSPPPCATPRSAGGWRNRAGSSAAARPSPLPVSSRRRR